MFAGDLVGQDPLDRTGHLVVGASPGSIEDSRRDTPVDTRVAPHPTGGRMVVGVYTRLEGVASFVSKPFAEDAFCAVAFGPVIEDHHPILARQSSTSSSPPNSDASSSSSSRPASTRARNLRTRSPVTP